MNPNPNLLLVILQLPCHNLRDAFLLQFPHGCPISIFICLLVITTIVILSSFVVVYLLLVCFFTRI